MIRLTDYDGKINFDKVHTKEEIINRMLKILNSMEDEIEDKYSIEYLIKSNKFHNKKIAIYCDNLENFSKISMLSFLLMKLFFLVKTLNKNREL